ncbi:ABC transporter ATP-binding protein [bacterium]|nr:ABC transporter ATP-binding protein [bacterium]
MNAEYIVKADQLTKSYVMAKGELPVLKGITLNIQAGEILSIVGPSGVGKSTLLHILGALDRPSEGRVTVDGIAAHELSEEKMAQFRNEKIGFVFQFHHLLPEFTALENVLMPSLIAGKSIDQSRKRGEELLKNVGLSGRMSHRPNELSGGEQQRVAVARALMNNPKLILADEPSGNLDRESSESLHDLLFQLCEEKNQTFVIVTHNEKLAARSHRTITMFDGKISSDTHR